MGSDGALDKGDAAAADAAAIASSAGAASSSSPLLPRPPLLPSSSSDSPGSIGMGKSAVASMFSRRGIPVLDADAIVRDLYSAGGAAVRLVDAAFPGCLDSEGAIDRAKLGARVVGDPAALDRLNALVHPLVESEGSAGSPGLVEGGAARGARRAAAVRDGRRRRRRRRRGGLGAGRGAARPRAGPPRDDGGKFEGIHSRQIPDAEKRGRADFVIDTGVSLEETEAHVGALIEGLRGRKGAGKWRKKVELEEATCKPRIVSFFFLFYSACLLWALECGLSLEGPKVEGREKG